MKQDDSIFFVVGTGRCGTVWLSRLLNTSKVAKIHHERYGADRAARELGSPKESASYIKRRVIDVNEDLKQKRFYGEVNPYMLYHIDALRVILGAKIYLLVRDGRDVVRSWHSRKIFDGGHWEKVLKPEGDSKFEKVCWWWNQANSLALSKNPEVIILERLIEEWRYFNSCFSFLEIPKKTWDANRLKRENVSPSYNLPHYRDWTDEHREIFDKHCGDLMKQLGYKI